MKKALSAIFEAHRKTFEDTFTSQDQLTNLERMAQEIVKIYKSGRKLLLCGNGGSAADSQHIAAEFIARFKRERKSLPAIALSTDTSILTAMANDYDYSKVFSRQVEGLGQSGDILIAISTSGNSPSILDAAHAARQAGLLVLGFTGQTGGKLKALCDICFQAQSKNTPNIQEMHITALHAVSEVVEDALFGA